MIFISPLPIALLLFFTSLIIVMVTAAWFTHRLEALCELFGLSIGILSLLSAIGANIPNYAASTDAIITGHTGVGIGSSSAPASTTSPSSSPSARWPPIKPQVLRLMLKKRRMRAASPGTRSLSYWASWQLLRCFRQQQ